ncbi:hypothetical protein [Candidatus Similichlamydia epinepheli]|uniref:hypothetical protein n=1 Tax=Candidatus Similichlamydia epinepheli TaxID=1903953 RepID=UPI000D3461BF|nr:hypothetical protein [Candidatus Similichlamydia epinepheli]
MTRRSKKMRDRSCSPRRRRVRLVKKDPVDTSCTSSFRKVSSAVPESSGLNIFVGKISKLS